MIPILRVWISFYFILISISVFSQNKFLFDSSTIEIKPLNINSKEAEFSPFIINKTFYYTSSKERKIGDTHMEKSTEHQMLDLYKGLLVDSITVKEIKPLLKQINSDVNQATCFFDYEASRLYYSGNMPTKNRNKEYKIAIFSSEFKNNEFLTPRLELAMPDTFSAAHPMIFNGKMYFSSNILGGKGKTDIYYATKIDNQWTEIKNCDWINSPENEFFPFAINDNEIYFSSNRIGGYGNLDIYKYSSLDSITTIENLGAPINSKFDDFSAYIDTTQERGYFSSNRRKNQDDIYFFVQTWQRFNNCKDPIVEDYCYNLTEESTLESDSLKGYYYQWSFGDGTKEKGLTVRHCFPEPGMYNINLNIIDSVTRAVFMSQAAFELKVDSIIQLKINCLDTVLQNKKITINTDWTYLPENKIKGYYFEIDNKRLRGKTQEYSFEEKGKHKILLGVNTFNFRKRKKELLCTTKEIVCVDSTTWLAYEKRKIDDIMDKFKYKNIKNDSSLLSKMDYEDVALNYNKKGLNGNLIADEFKKIVNEINLKNMLNGNSITNNNINNEKEIFTSTDSSKHHYLSAIVDTLMDIKEGDDITFKVHLGKSKVAIDTTLLNDMGIKGIDVKIINNEYNYTYANKKHKKDIQKDYKKAIEIGIKSAVVLSYKKNSIIEDQSKNIANTDFNEYLLLVKNLLEKNNLAITTNSTSVNKTDTTKSNNIPVGNSAINNVNNNVTEETLIATTDIQKLNNEFLKEFGDVEIKDLEFKVQVGVFKKRKTYDFPKLKGLGKVSNETLDDGSTRMTMGGSYKTLREAIRHNKKIVQAGQGDAFVSVYYKGKRIAIENLRRGGILVKPNVVQDSVSKTKLTINAANINEYTNNDPTEDSTNPLKKNNKDKSLSDYSEKSDSMSTENLVFVPRTNIQKKTMFYTEKYGDISADGLEFKVQIAVFKYRSSYSFPKLQKLGKIETETTEEGGTRMLIGGTFKTLNEAFEFNKKVVLAGQLDAFVAIYFEGKRIYIENLERKGIFVSKQH
ncbi:MAG: PKD domain-containing protein [Bacteroidota bacterium]|nr:PKD domain-containing protein [Bacteroidota bacterium]